MLGSKARELRSLAKQNLQTYWLRRWWCKKYKLPPTDERYLSYTFEMLLVEYFEDQYDENAAGMLSFDAETPEGDVVLQTGDPEIDEIERRLAAGEDPNVVLAGWGENLGNKSPKEEKSPEEETPKEINDDYSEPLKWTP